MPGATRRQAMRLRAITGGIMVTWTWILIAVAVAGLVALTARRSRNPANDPDSAQATPQSTEQIASAGTDTQDRATSATSVLRPLPDTQSAQPDPARLAALGTDPGTGGQPYPQLLEHHEMQHILGQWKDIQAEFVDGPR